MLCKIMRKLKSLKLKTY